MTTATLKRVIAEVRIAAQETPRLYFSGVRDVANLFGSLFQARQPSQPKRHTSSSKKLAPGSTPSSIRHGKKQRHKAK